MKFIWFHPCETLEYCLEKDQIPHYRTAGGNDEIVAAMLTGTMAKDDGNDYGSLWWLWNF